MILINTIVFAIILHFFSSTMSNFGLPIKAEINYLFDVSMPVFLLKLNFENLQKPMFCLS